MRDLSCILLGLKRRQPSFFASRYISHCDDSRLTLCPVCRFVLNGPHQTFTTATFPTLIFVEVYDVEFIPVEAPPAPPPPAYPGGRWPLVFSTSMFYGESGSTFSVRDAREDYVRLLMETMGKEGPWVSDEGYPHARLFLFSCT